VLCSEHGLHEHAPQVLLVHLSSHGIRFFSPS
jgi:hypothetical protein